MHAASLGLAVALVVLVVSSGGLVAGGGVSADARPGTPILPGLGADDPRSRLDPDKAPWRAIGKLQFSLLNHRRFCTAALVGPSTVLTAAHCVFNGLTQRYFTPGSLHFLIGYDGGRYTGHGVGVKIETGPGYDPIRPYETIGSDWVLVSLDTRIGVPDRILPMSSEPPEIGSPVMLGGYQQDHPLLLMADTECRIIGRETDARGQLLLQHNCTGTSGDSGAPLLMEKAGKWYTAGVDVAAKRGVASGLAVIIDEARRHL